MSANDDFPRGTSQSVRPAAGVSATITIPACPGIMHIIDAVEGALSCFVAAGGTAVDVIVTDTLSGKTLNIGVVGNSGTLGDTNNVSEDNLDFACTLGGSVSIAMGAVPNFAEHLLVKWHDI